MIENKIISVAIDGPAGVGKSTITKLLAQKIGWPSLETGALYRALTFFCLKDNVNVHDEKEIILHTKNVNVEVEYIDNIQNVFVNGENFTPFLRKSEVEQNVALVAKVPEVRQIARKVQRSIAQNQNVVVEGRDIGTVVLANSVNKFYLTASPEVRAIRRYKELFAKGDTDASYEVILKEIVERDYLDMTRKASPLLPAKNAIIIDTSNRSPDEIVNYMIKNIRFSLCDKKQCAEM